MKAITTIRNRFYQKSITTYYLSESREGSAFNYSNIEAAIKKQGTKITRNLKGELVVMELQSYNISDINLMGPSAVSSPIEEIESPLNRPQTSPGYQDCDPNNGNTRKNIGQWFVMRETSETVGFTVPAVVTCDVLYASKKNDDSVIRMRGVLNDQGVEVPDSNFTISEPFLKRETIKVPLGVILDGKTTIYRKIDSEISQCEPFEKLLVPFCVIPYPA